MTTPVFFTAACLSIWGAGWSQDVERELGINERNVRKMGRGAIPVPAGVWAELAELLEAEAGRLREMAKQAREASRAKGGSPRAGASRTALRTR